MATFFSSFPSAEVKPANVNIGDMVNTLRGVQAYKQAEQVNPEILKQQQAKTASDVMSLEDKRFRKIADSQISMINNPLILQAEKDPSSVEPAKLEELVLSRGLATGKSLGIPEEKTRELLVPYLETAKNNPGGLRGFYKERHIMGLDDAARTSALAASGTAVNTGAGGYTVQTGEFGPVKAGEVVPGSAFQQLLGPGSQIEITNERDVNNNQIAFIKSPDGKQVYRTTVPNGSTPGVYPTGAVPQQSQQQGFTPPGMIRESQQPTTMQLVNQGANAAPVVPPAGETTETGRAYQEQTIGARGQVQPAGVALNNIRTVRQYLPLAQTGASSETIAKLQSIFGNVAGSKPEEFAAAARDIIEKNIADLALQKNSALGGKFAADLSAVQSSLSSAGKNPTAIAKVMDQLEPLMQHVQNYSTGLNRAVEKSPNKYYVKPAYDNAMNDAFDIRALMMKNAFDSGGKPALDKFVKENNVSVRDQQLLLQKLQRYGQLLKGEL